MSSSSYKKGSEWRKWDLHIHTPYTKLNNQYGNNDDVWENFCKKIEESDIAVFGITDYFSLDNYFTFIKKFKEIYPNSNKIFFPNIEFRIDSKNSKNEHIQIHVIFSNDIHEDTLNQFLIRLPLVSTDNFNLTNKYCTSKDLQDVTYEKAMLTVKDLKEQLENNFSSDQYLIIGVTNGYGSLRPNRGDGRGAEYAKELDKVCHAFFGNKDNVDFYLNKKEQRSQFNLPPKAVLLGSDSHSFQDIEQKFTKYYTWIKADSTFEGLRQILYEPEERVKIQEDNPEYEFNKPTFSKILINEEVKIFNNENVKFNKTELHLNKNLITIIGGRGSGKSVLLNYIAYTFNKPILAYQKNDSTAFKDNKDFIIEWQKENKPDPEKISFNALNKGNLDIIFIEQGKLKNISDYRVLSNEIKKLLKIEELRFDENLDKEIIELLEEIQRIKNWFEYENERGEKVNSEDFNKKKKNEASKLLETITTQENKQKLETYISNINKIGIYNNTLTKLDNLTKILNQQKDDINKSIADINSEIENDIEDKIPDVSFNEQINTIEKIKTKLNTILQDRNNSNHSIKKEFENQGYKGDLETLFSNAEKYQNDINEAELKLKEIDKQKKQLEEKITQRNKIGQKLRNEYERQKNEINNAWKNLLNTFPETQRVIINKILSNRDISIEGRVYFDLEKFIEKLKDYLDRRKYKNLSKDLNINSLDDYWNFIENKLHNFIEGDDKEDIKQPLEELFLTLKERKEYLYTIPRIKFMNKELEYLSVGQRGTLYLLLQLATEAFSSPLIFDQPEDDLDNEFITKELVKLFKELKKYRQIIISTHNANLVVTADAEQVIVADNENECISYVSGSLENPQIIKNVCNILEGGEEAFQKREKKYGLDRMYKNIFEQEEINT